MSGLNWGDKLNSRFWALFLEGDNYVYEIRAQVECMDYHYLFSLPRLFVVLKILQVFQLSGSVTCDSIMADAAVAGHQVKVF